MKKVIASIFGFSLFICFQNNALAYPPSYDYDRGGYHHADGRGPGPGGPGRSGPDPRYARDGGPRAASHYKRGERLAPHHLKNERYYVNDWRRYDLRRPPKGHRWVRIDGDFILVSVVSGVIASILLHH